MQDSEKAEKVVTTSQPPVTHKQKRALATRRALLAAARKVFARDGFEHTRLEDIALEAGKTRGAFYDNFDGKEDIFFAIFEDDLERDREAIGERWNSLATPEEQAQLLATHLAQIVEDRQRVLLNLEFKLYAIRQPRQRKRLADLHAKMCLRPSDTEVQKLFLEFNGLEIADWRSLNWMIGAILDGIGLNLLFDSEALQPAHCARLFQECLRIALMMQSVRPAGKQVDLPDALPQPAERRVAKVKKT